MVASLGANDPAELGSLKKSFHGQQCIIESQVAVQVRLLKQESPEHEAMFSKIDALLQTHMQVSSVLMISFCHSLSSVMAVPLLQFQYHWEFYLSLQAVMQFRVGLVRSKRAAVREVCSILCTQQTRVPMFLQAIMALAKQSTPNTKCCKETMDTHHHFTIPLQFPDYTLFVAPSCVC